MDGGYSGSVVASTDGAEVLRTPVGLNRETERYPVTFDHGGVVRCLGIRHGLPEVGR